VVVAAAVAPVVAVVVALTPGLRTNTTTVRPSAALLPAVAVAPVAAAVVAVPLAAAVLPTTTISRSDRRAQRARTRAPTS
jgi:hypothetical protein